MLYEIDESCLEILDKNDLNAIGFFEQLALDRRKCKNIVVAKREVFYKLAKTEGLSDLSKTIYRILGNRMSEMRILIKNTQKYCRVVAKKTEKNLLKKDNSEVIILNVEEHTLNDFTSKPLMLAENERDIEFYKIIGKYYMKKNALDSLNLNYESSNGGGSTISNVLENIIAEDNRMCICIVDSDKKYVKDSIGNTMKGILEVIKNQNQVFFEVLPLQIHEIENLIPISVLEDVVKIHKLDKQGIDFLKYLLKNDKSMESPILFFDFKKGILKSDFVLDNEVDDEGKKAFDKKRLYRQYWKKYIEGFGQNIETCEETKLIQGICNNLLKCSIDYIKESELFEKGEILEIEQPIQELWDEIGVKIYCWGCAGRKLAI